MKRYKVSFTVSGDMIGDDTLLNIGSIKDVLMCVLDRRMGLNYFGNRDIDTLIDDLVIKKV